MFFFQRNKTNSCWGDLVTRAPCCSVTVGLLTVSWRLKHLRQSVSPLLCLRCALLFIVVLPGLLHVPLSAFTLGVCSYLCSLRHRQRRGAQRPPRKPWKRGPGNKRLVWDFCCPSRCQAPHRGRQLVALLKDNQAFNDLSITHQRRHPGKSFLPTETFLLLPPPPPPPPLLSLWQFTTEKKWAFMKKKKRKMLRIMEKAVGHTNQVSPFKRQISFFLLQGEKLLRFPFLNHKQCK